MNDNDPIKGWQKWQKLRAQEKERVHSEDLIVVALVIIISIIVAILSLVL